jgi:type VI secretion system Hcp family effector
MRPAPALRLALACCTLAAAAVPHLASAADPIYVTIAGVQGESTSLKGAIDVLSFSGGVFTPAGPVDLRGGNRAGRASFSDFSLMFVVSAASPVLSQAVASQETFPDAVISIYKSAGRDRPEAYLTYTLSHVRVSSYAVSGAAGGGAPTESVSLTYSKIKTEYRPLRPDGTFDKPITVCWDLHTNRSC